MADETDIRDILDNELKPAFLGDNFEVINANAIKIFQKLFVENLHFDLIEGQFGEVGEQILTDEWNQSAEARDAYLIAEKDNFRIIYVVIKKLTRYRERSTISSLKRERWAMKGEYICIFYAENSSIWHIVCPHYTEGRTILRRYILGEGENHRTVSNNLTVMDTRLTEPLFERVQDAFKVQVVTEDFYKNYKEIFEEIKNEIVKQKISVSNAKKFTHLLLNRLMFIYFIQKKGWINNDKNFIFNYLKKYKSSEDNNLFYSKWLNNLFFKAMSNPISEKSINDFDNEINNILNNIPFLNGGLFEEYNVDRLEFTLSDEFLFKIIENFLEEYNFTVTEESPFDLDIAIDPAMLGKIYESLIAEEERGKSGIFYTPRIEVDLMCRFGIYEYFLQDKNEILPANIKNLEEKLIYFIFKPLEEWNTDNNIEFEFLRKAILHVKVVDPACGSGAFLVGMFQVLIELFRKLGLKPDYNLKESIIYNSIHGVDIKDWAVRMAEFRLWLALIESEDKIPNKSPILPNFSFKLQCGDSIIQRIGTTTINLQSYRKKISKELDKNLKEIDKLKKKYFEGEKDLLDDIREQQLQIIIRELQKENKNFQLKTKQLSQKNLFGDLTEDSRRSIDIINKKILKNEELIQKLQSINIKDLFFWDLNFPEVMLMGGFDIVIANPPYVRQEKIINQGIDPEELKLYSNNHIKKLKTRYKNELIKYVKDTFNIELGKKCDLYTFFFFKAIELLNLKGIIVFISSLSWLDVDFGKFLQKSILFNTNLEYIIDNQIKRSFEEANVNTIITILKNKDRKGFLYGKIKFITLKKQYEEINTPATISEIMIENNKKQVKIINYFGEKFEIYKNNNFRKISIDEKSLWKLGIKNNQFLQTTLSQENNRITLQAIGNYETGQWGKFLRAPSVFYKILENNKEKLIPLNKYVEIKYAIKTGANEFFYLPKPGKTNKYFKSEIDESSDELVLFPKNNNILHEFDEKGYKIKSNNEIFRIELKFLKPIIFTLKEITQHYVTNDTLKYYVLIASSNTIKGKKIEQYVNWGLDQEYQNRPTCQSRSDWLALVGHDYVSVPLIFPSKIGERMPIFLNPENILIDKKQYKILPKSDEHITLLFVILNSTLFRLFIEINSRQLTGAQAIADIDVNVVEDTLIPDIDILDDEIKEELIALSEELKNSVADSIREELGALNPEDFNINRVKPIRRKIDKIVMGKILGLEESDQVKIYKSLIKIVKNRLEKADSV